MPLMTPFLTRTLFALAVGLVAAGLSMTSVSAGNDTPASSQGAAAVMYQPSMNVFRRFETDTEAMYAFYRDVLGLEQLTTYGAVARFQAGASEFKLTRRVANRTYEPGGVKEATGLRMISFFFPEEAALVARFTRAKLPAPQFQDDPVLKRRSAIVTDPDGQAVELVVVPNMMQALPRIEVGLTVSDIEKSRTFYRGFVGLEELPPYDDARFGTKVYPFRHGSTTINLRSFGTLPSDTGSGGIQYVVSNVNRVDELARAQKVPIETPLTANPQAALRTVWLQDPDGITNYFAETTWSRPAATATASR
jgi:catechol 2,3-dioxygenase-like lactoylglutathione lyase family enzyme